MKVKLLTAIALFNVLAAYSQVDIMEPYNGDFENGMTYWRFFEVPENVGSSTSTTTDAISGEYAMKIDLATDYGSVADRGLDNWSAGVPVTGGVFYRLKAFVKGEPNADPRIVKVRITLGFFNSAGGVIKQEIQDHPLTGVYTEKTVISKAPDNAARCWLAFRLFDATDPCAPLRSMYIDNVRLLRPAGVSIEEATAENTSSFNLSGYPNPFGTHTTITYNLVNTSYVTLRVFNTLGKEVAHLVDRQQLPGRHEINWTSDYLQEGIYLLRLDVTSSSETGFATNRLIMSNN
ncbi:MAG: T9SS type A sorting domain-containing protein [Bacteroidota bacterium]